MIAKLYAKSLYIRQRSSIDFAPDPSEVTKGLDRQISEPIQGERLLHNILLLYWSSGKRVDYQSPPQDKNSASLTRAESETKPTEIDGKIKSNGVEAKSIEAKPENTNVKNCSVNDTSSASEAKPAAGESAVPSQPEPGQSRELQPQPNAEKVQQAKDRNETGKEQAKDREEPAKVEKVEVAKDRNESAKVEKVGVAKEEPAQEQAKPRIEGGEGQAKTSAEAGKVENSVLVTRPTRRVPPGGHCSQLW